MEVTPSGITKEVKPVQPLKALSLIVNTSSGIIVFLQPNNNILDEVTITALQLFL